MQTGFSAISASMVSWMLWQTSVVEAVLCFCRVSSTPSLPLILA